MNEQDWGKLSVDLLILSFGRVAQGCDTGTIDVKLIIVPQVPQ